MFGISPGSVLDVGIGMAVMYLMLSLIGTAVNEFFAALVKLRSKTLSTSLLSIVDDERLRADFYNSGVIAATKDSAGGHPSYISSTDFAHAIINSLDPSKPFPVIADVRQSTLLMADSNIRDVLLAQLGAAEGNIERLRDGLAQWFDAAMDRVSGVYTRYLRYIALAVGLLIAASFNADSLSVATHLWQDPTLRTQMVAAAAPIVSGSEQNDKIGTGAPGGTSATNVDDTNSPSQVDQKIAALEKRVSDADATLQPLPIGWSLGWGSNPLLRVLGWLLTAVAVSFGAHFWFDILSKFINIRASGPKPARSADN